MKTKAIPVVLAALWLAAALPAFAQDTDPSTDDPGTTTPASGGEHGNLAGTPEMIAAAEELARQQQSQLTGGDEATACEAILCLSTGSPPGECAGALRRYFSINLSKPWKTIQARINFLKLCPAADDSPQMSSLVEAIGHSAGRCDAGTLNQTLRVYTGIEGEYEISNQMPSYCEDYFSHMYASDVDNIRPRYVEKYVTRTYQDEMGQTHYEYAGGYWVDPQSSAPVAQSPGNAVPASKDPAAVGY